MRRRPLHLSPQVVDPIGGLVDAPIVAVGAAITSLIAFTLTAAHWDEVGNTVAAALGVLLVVAAAIVLFAATLPSRAPFTPERLGLIVALAVAAAVAEYVSTAGTNRFLYDDYGAVVVGLLILSLAPFCTWVPLVVAGLLSTAVSTILVLGAAPTTETDAPVISLVAVNAAIILSLTAAAAVYSATVVREVLAWQRQTNQELLRRDATQPDAFGSQSPSRVQVLRSEVLPFLARVTTADHLSRADADRARELAEALRGALRAGVEATWLDELVESVRRTHGTPVSVADRAGDARRLDDHQRAAVTALLTWIGDRSRATGVHVAVERAADAPRGRITVAADRHEDWRPRRRELHRFVAVARIVGLRARALATGENVTVEFDYAID
ncbi:hypothetical protein [Agromyces aerolatus]|uniref:hypothetical protein n=1 Tax=Agromyces sp. LY-1074 TaxID=3074080 RepID=UPI0028553BAE|nr:MULTISPECIES: hypothetical protein [unclassified Agromyces]MDR5701468.1 hypothetical protein [Agromyces sp. LY-1074]MDR5704465.1 hypothetical protein [Agromyces sp. LY-1358]